MGNNQSCGIGVLNNTQHHLTVGLSMGATHYWENKVGPGEVFYRWPGAVWYTPYAYITEFSSKGKMTYLKAAWEVMKSIFFGLAIAAVVAAVVVGLVYGIQTFGNCYQLVKSGLQKLGWKADSATLNKLVNFYKKLPQNINKSTEEILKELKEKLWNSFEELQIETAMRGCYAGDVGTWLEVVGGPTVDISEDGELQFHGQDLKFIQRDFEYFKERLDYPNFENGDIKFTEYSKTKYVYGLCVDDTKKVESGTTESVTTESTTTAESTTTESATAESEMGLASSSTESRPVTFSRQFSFSPYVEHTECQCFLDDEYHDELDFDGVSDSDDISGISEEEPGDEDADTEGDDIYDGIAPV